MRSKLQKTCQGIAYHCLKSMLCPIHGTSEVQKRQLYYVKCILPNTYKQKCHLQITHNLKVALFLYQRNYDVFSERSS